MRGRSAIRRWILSARRRCSRSARRSGARWSVIGSPWPGSTRSTSISRVTAQRLEVVHERLRALARAVARPRDQRVRGDVAEQVVGRDQDAPLGGRGRRCRWGSGPGGGARAACGRAARAPRRRAAARVTSTRAPQARKARETDWSARHHVLGDAVAQHDVAGEVVVGLRPRSEKSLHERHGRVDRRHLGARVRGHQRRPARGGRCAGG